LPYKPKRRTKAQIAREAGLEPLADQLLTRDTLHMYAQVVGKFRLALSPRAPVGQRASLPDRAWTHHLAPALPRSDL
jgi:protein Tex